MSEHFDLAVVGAGFAGLTLARRAAQAGLRVAVLERKPEPGAQVVLVPDCGHLPHVEQPQAFVAALEGFLAAKRVAA